MKLRWEGETAYADREYIAALFEVSEMTVRRHCRPVRHEPRDGPGGGPGGGRAMYDVEACATALDGVAPRPEMTLTAIRTRNTIRRQRADRRGESRGQGDGPPT